MFILLLGLWISREKAMEAFPADGIDGWDCILVVKDKMSRPMMEKAGVLGRRMTHIKKAMRP